MTIRFRRLRIILLLLTIGWMIAELTSFQSSGQTRQKEDSFKRIIQPFIAENCLGCHNAKTKTGGLDLESFRSTEDILNNRELWERVTQKIRTGEMPPKSMPRPDEQQVKAVADWIEARFAGMD